MDSVINKLTEIEEAADAIVAHAEEQKAVLDKEYEERKKAFDKELEAKTQSELSKIQEELEEDKKRLLDGQSGANAGSIRLLLKEYDENHKKYAQEILKRITEV